MTLKFAIIMGIVNVTPDSFSDGGMYYGAPVLVQQRVQELLAEGAEIIDIGGESSRPGSTPISADEEIKRVVPAIRAVRELCAHKALISVDTYKSSVAAAAIEAGAGMVNSLGGLRFDPHLGTVIRQAQCKLMAYHVHGSFQTMHEHTGPEVDMVASITDFFSEQLAIGMRMGIDRDQWLLDPGIGFGKTVSQNVHILRNLRRFGSFELPIVVGVSRKGHLGQLLQDTLGFAAMPGTMDRLEAALAETALAVFNGASVIRTHDVRATKRFVRVLQAILPAENDAVPHE